MAAFPAAACTTFCMKDAKGLVFGRGYDFDIGEAMILVNPRGVAKVSTIEPNPARWNAEFGSVTFNQFGKDSPAGGVNERGLIMEVMDLEATKLPPPDNRPNIGTLEFIQYLLDTSKNVEDAISKAYKVRIATQMPVHFLLADREGNAAAIEFLRGRMVVHHGDGLPDCALANSTYARSRDYESQSKANLPALPRGDAGSLERYARAARAVRAPAAIDVATSFAILDTVVQDNTRWQIVYDLPNNAIHYRTMANRELRRIDLARIDYACPKGGRMTDIDAGRGDMTAALAPYTAEANERQMLAAFAKVPRLGMSEPEVRAEAKQVESRRCVAG